MNRSQRRQLERSKGIFKNRKPYVENWACPKCGHTYDRIYVQAKTMPYLFCYKGCEDYFDLNAQNVTAKLYPNGKPF